MEPYTTCEIVAIQGKYDFKPFALGFQKDSPFLPMFNFYLNEMKEKGSLKQILAKYEPSPQICPDYKWENLRAQKDMFHLLLCTVSKDEYALLSK